MQTNKKIDPLNGDHSFKMWFKIMWENTYIQLFTLFFTVFIVQLFNVQWVLDQVSSASNDGLAAALLTGIGMLLPILGSIIIPYLGFYKFWKELINS